MKKALILFSLLAINILISAISGCNNNDKTSKSDEETDEFSLLVKTFPDSIPLQLKFHEKLFTNGNQKKAMDGLMKLAEQYPERTDLLNQLAEMAIQTADTNLSIHYLNQSIEVNPDQSDAAFMLAGIYASQKNPIWEKIATQLINKKDDPIAAAKGHYLIGIQLANANKINEAMNEFDKAIVSNFTFTDAYIEKAILLFETQKTDDAIELLFKAQELDRKSPDISFWLGECFLRKKDEQRALAFFEQTLDLDPEYKAATDRIANIKH